MDGFYSVAGRATMRLPYSAQYLEPNDRDLCKYVLCFSGIFTALHLVLNRRPANASISVISSAISLSTVGLGHALLMAGCFDLSRTFRGTWTQDQWFHNATMPSMGGWGLRAFLGGAALPTALFSLARLSGLIKGIPWNRLALLELFATGLTVIDLGLWQLHSGKVEHGKLRAFGAP